MTKGKSSYSALKTKLSTTSCLGSSPESSQEITSSIFLGSSSRTIFMLAMMTEATTVDEKIAEMARAIAKLNKTVEEKDLQIATLMNKLEIQNRGESRMANLKLNNICCKGLIHPLQRRLTTNTEALPSSLLYRSSNCKT